jgi:ATP-dependent Clp protease ATP-binding subunit ClpB
MDFEKLTDRARGFLQAAQTIAVREHHQRIAPAHLLKALLDDEQGMAAGLIQAAGGDAKAAKREVDALVAKIPAVTGSGATQAPALDGDTIRILDQAEQVAKKAGDSYVTVERMLLAMALAKGTEVGSALAKAGLTPQNLNAAIEKLRGGRTADTQAAEDRYDALKKYARDLTEAARNGKLDPVIGRDEEIRRTVQVLARRTKNNPVLIGEPGVGKTAIPEGHAVRKAKGHLPDGLKDNPHIPLHIGTQIACAK